MILWHILRSCADQRNLRQLPLLSPHNTFWTMKHFKFFMKAAFTARAAILIGCLYERTEERMRLQRFRFEFGMELATQEIRMIGKFHDLDIRSVGSRAGDLQACAGQEGLILAIELIAVTMPFADLG